ncbi:YbaB/EbfC family nucleoid-associated protein [Helcococcus kunzii]|uniref:Nucleoid-associated protein HMPREF9709_00055 n=1 Tax=Helcococcus kunzii ATCC 51366 TaxID=883114 RepID=H3NL44_9FIRM|nr:YbaB/EbfC family nucleoid-associated protein [Helcococcus kunzii]EHR36300.1 YbaB/EbfC family DNA-binding protein [Helcococcus kunzii ATCC 51366]MCT1796544.1 YbaB/EbfC family nucleoid-associated protein [Helcococcus kunzii]MCT1989631.1 YbaB/EbfC family nucleoid-associated protein [Helcococcus kunzii]QUY63991.1 YbaB/EbfC family nucleoid-associated protein [Helcococcus kunzii]QZO76459.1 YbaB/EbfC family nucleoid-associated protein [Helcococcus kunzii]
MARRGGFGGGNNMGQMMKQVQQMQKRMEDAQKEIEESTVTATSGGGMVEVEANGKKQIISIKIDPEAVDPEDVEILQDMVLTAVNDAISQVEKLSEEKLGKITGGMNLPGIF